MWICFDPIGSREGWRASILFLVFFSGTYFGIDASLTNAAASNVPHNTVASEVSLPISTHHENDECRNVTTDNRAGIYTYIYTHVKMIIKFRTDHTLLESFRLY